MNVFILCSGRSGSTTFIRACQHIENFSAGHETRFALLGESRLDFPDNHIEADNRLSWVLGKLGKKYGSDAYYVHLMRDIGETAASFNRRWDYPGSLVRAYTQGILMAGEQRGLKYCRDMLETIHHNIEYFLRDKPNQMTIHLENIREDFPRFWEWIGAEGDLDAALRHWNIRYNQSENLGIFGRFIDLFKR